ncbi:unnamed protein product [Closterium sp. Naga37s-1]|nr:unnamed protein product [Closterium sp. Naga37s-1]
MPPHCAALDRRYLFEGNLTGPIPELIGALTSLHDLQVLSNSLGGTIPAAIGNLTALTNLCSHSPATPLSPFLPPPAPLPFPLNPPSL